MNNANNKAKNTLVPSRREAIARDEANARVNTNPVLHPNRYNHTIAKQLMEMALHQHMHKDSIEACIEHGLSITNCDKRKLSAIVSMAYNTTLKLVADALDASLEQGYVEPDVQGPSAGSEEPDGLSNSEEHKCVESVQGSTHYDTDFDTHLKVIDDNLCYLSDTGLWLKSVHRDGRYALTTEKAIIKTSEGEP